MARFVHIMLIDGADRTLGPREVERIEQVLRPTLPHVTVQASKAPHLQWAEPNEPDVVLVNLDGARFTLETIDVLRERWPGVPMLGIIMTQPEADRAVVDIGEERMDDFLRYPFEAWEFAARMRRLGSLKSAWRNTREGKPSYYRIDSLVGTSGRFQKQVDKVALFAQADSPVLVLGETGTGKELFARAIHYHGGRKDKAFIPINCAALPDQLFENELFGHVRGAYTGASCEGRGLVQEAEGGTLFLDEVETLTLAAQAKLLRFVQEREYRPLGCTQTRMANIRILAATNCDIRQAVRERTFREDLYHRLNVLSLVVPPLRERIEDIPLLAAHFMRRYRRPGGKQGVRLASGALQKLLDYSWPGNVRELESTLQRAMVCCAGETIEPREIEFTSTSIPCAAPDASLRTAKCQAVEDVERAYLVRALFECQGNVTKAALAAGKERRSFQRLLRKYGIDRQSYVDQQATCGEDGLAHSAIPPRPKVDSFRFSG